MTEVTNALAAIKGSITRAEDALFELYFTAGSDEDQRYCKEVIEYYMERAFIQILCLLDNLNLERTHELLNNTYKQAKETGIDESAMYPHQEEPYLVWASYLRHYINAISLLTQEPFPATTVVKDIIPILRATVYSITDKRVFPDGPPKSESEVHARIEAVLKCIFPDLKSRPALTKSIKNFEPDTGLPSIKTLIEYKYISNEADAKRIVDEVLADTRGYVSKEWNTFIYVIYETHRVKPESQWKQLMLECGVDTDSTNVIVLSGEPVVRAS